MTFSNPSQTSGVLIATLGTKPQVVTTAVDLITRAGHQLQEVVVLHTLDAKDVLGPALEVLRQEFATCESYQALKLSPHLISRPNGRPVPDVESPEDAEVIFRELYRCVWVAKRAGQSVHLSIVGGRKVMAVYGMATAQLLFDETDYLWYVLVSGSFFDTQRLHPEPADEARLISVPVLRWSNISPILTDLSEIDDPFQAIERQSHLRLQEQLEMARSFVLGALTPSERRVVEVLVREGRGDIEIAEQLVLSPRTVEHHLGEAYAKAAVHWGLPNVTRAQLVALLNFYFRVQ